MGAAENGVFRFMSVPDHPTSAMITNGSKCMNSALKTIENVGNAFRDDLKGLIVFIPADFTAWHRTAPFGERNKRWNKTGASCIQEYIERD
jgi:hypothetical protein